MDKKEFRVLTKHCFLIGKNAAEAQQWLDKHYKAAAPGQSTIIDWYAEFNSNPRKTKRSAYRKRTKVQELQEIILKKPKDQLLKIVDGGKDSGFRVICNYLDLRKKLSSWVPRVLSPELKEERVEKSEFCLKLFKQNKVDFLQRYVSMDAISIHYRPLDADDDAGSSPTRAREDSNMLLFIFWDAKGIILLDYVHGDFSSYDFYIESLERLNAEIQVKRLHFQGTRVLFHEGKSYYNSPLSSDKIKEFNFELLPYPPYSPDLSPSDYWLSPNIREVFEEGKQFCSVQEIVNKVKTDVESRDESFYKNGIEMLEELWSKCIALKGEYFDESNEIA